MLCVWSLRERVSNEFQLFLYLSKSSCKECSEICPQGVHRQNSEFISERLGEITLFSSLQKCKVSTGAMQGVHRLRRNSEFATRGSCWKDCYCGGCTESKSSILGSIEELPQGVRARIFPKGLGNFSIKLKRASAWSIGRRHSEGVLQEDKFRKRTLCLFRRNHQGVNWWLEFSVENSRGPGSRSIF